MVKGRIPQKDIEAIRDLVAIEDVVGDYVVLTPAGNDSWKGLSPFTEEKTPSFHVRPNHGYYHCFSTGEGGDVYSFLMKMEHISFVEAVEQLADRANYRITYEGGGPAPQQDRGTRKRLLAAMAAAQQFYRDQWTTEAALPARKFLFDRGFDDDLIEQFGCGFSPAGWDTLTRHLQQQGFSFKELEAAGLSKMGSRGTPIDRFHRRLMWPIRTPAGETIGFGARKVFEDDKLGKYMNTPETMLYKKSQVLFGLDRARQSVVAERRAVVVEGYTDVMAMHAAGVTTAVAACGTAFGDGHLAALRRYMVDDQQLRGEIIYTFDGDAAGTKAALRAFDGEQKFVGNSYVAVAPEGMDPCDLRQQRGDQAVRDLVRTRQPMVDFVLKAVVDRYDVGTIEGQSGALREGAAVVAKIEDPILHSGYVTRLGGLVGLKSQDAESTVRKEVAAARSRAAGRRGTSLRRTPASEARRRQAAAEPPRIPRPSRRSKDLMPQRSILKAALQFPEVAPEDIDSLGEDAFTHPAYRALFAAIAGAGGCVAAESNPQWHRRVLERITDSTVRSLFTELDMERFESDDSDDGRYAVVRGLAAKLRLTWLELQIAEQRARLDRSTTLEHDERVTLMEDLQALQQYHSQLAVQWAGQSLP